MRQFLIGIIGCILSVLQAGPVSGGELGIMAGMTDAHNSVRSRLGLPGLDWSDELARSARQWAVHLAREYGCSMRHSPRNETGDHAFGENLFWASGVKWSDGTNTPRRLSSEEVVHTWTAEEGNYSRETNACLPGKVCGHYTQIVWKDTRLVGCARAVCADSSQIWVCQYDPAGNIAGQKPY